MQDYEVDNKKTLDAFRKSVSFNKETIIQDFTSYKEEKAWIYYDSRPKTKSTEKKKEFDEDGDEVEEATVSIDDGSIPIDDGVPTLIIIPDVGGTCSMFYHQLVKLAEFGIRTVALMPPDYLRIENLIGGIETLMREKLGLRSAHFLGVGIGGLYVQALKNSKPDVVKSAVLCNSYSSTYHFKSSSVAYVTFAPTFMLKKHVMSGLPSRKLPGNVADSIDFAVTELDSLDGDLLSSQLVLKYTQYSTLPSTLTSNDVTVVESTGSFSCYLMSCIDEIEHAFPDARTVKIKDGGPYPYMSIPSFFNKVLIEHVAAHERKTSK